MKAYETSTTTLRTILSHPLLQRENIDATMESMADANADYKEVSDAIQFGLEGEGVGAVDVDEDELASELDALVKEREEEEAAEKLAAEEREKRASEARVKEARVKEVSN